MAVQKKCGQHVMCWLKNIPVVHPNSAKLFLWDVTNFIFIILNVTYVPIETVITSTFRDIYGFQWTLFMCLSFCVYVLSILLSSNQGYYDKGHCVMDRTKILRRYF